MKRFLMTASGSLAHSESSTITGGAFTVTSIPDPKVMIGDPASPAYVGVLKYLFVGGSAPGMVDGSVSTIVEQAITPVTSGIEIDEQPVPREGDKGLMGAMGVPIGGGAAVPVAGFVEIAAAGQNGVAA